MNAHELVSFKELVAAKQEFGKVDDALLLAFALIGAVEIHLGRIVGAADRTRMRGPHALLLHPVDEGGDGPRIRPFRIHIGRLHDALHHGELIGAVDDLKALREPRIFGVPAQNPVAETVEGADPHALQIVGKH